jgi:uncharacterized membrane protein YagU involved in acid resistance
MPSILCEALNGALAGVAATGPMTLFMQLVHGFLSEDRRALPPREVSEKATQALGVQQRLSEPEREIVSALAHFSFGGAAGALYGPLAASLPVTPLASGVCYGLSVWVTWYLGLLPATGLYRSPTREPPGRHLMLIGAHLVWGASLGVLTKWLSRATAEPQWGQQCELLGRSRHGNADGNADDSQHSQW